MRVVAYRFSEREEAESARSDVLETTEIRIADVAAVAEGGTVLGLRASEDTLPAVARIVENHGGEPLVDIDEAWTRRRELGN